MSNKRGTRSMKDTDLNPSTMFDPYSFNPGKARQAGMDMLYMQKLVELSCARFCWHGLPDSVDERFLEMTLLYNGAALFFYDTVNSRFLATRMAYSGPMNIYDNPTRFTAVGNAFTRNLESDECVPIWANKLRTPDMLVIQTYAQRLANADRTIDINMVNLRHPVLISTRESQRLSYINAFNQVVDGQPVIVGTEELGAEFGDAVQAINLTGNVGGDKAALTVQLAKHDIWNDCMTFLGINNASQDKKERLVTDEVSANDSQVLTFRKIGLDERNRACHQIEHMFGWDSGTLFVDWNSDVDQTAKSLTPDPIPADWEED